MCLVSFDYLDFISDSDSSQPLELIEESTGYSFTMVDNPYLKKDLLAYKNEIERRRERDQLLAEI